MVSLENRDFVVVVGSGDTSLGGYRLFRSLDAHSASNGNLIFSLNAVDVGVRRNFVDYLWAKFSRNKVIDGREELDKKRVLVAMPDNAFRIKEGNNPGVLLVFPENYEEYPSSIKNSDFGKLLKIWSDARVLTKNYIEALRQKNMTDNEIRDMLTAGQSKVDEVLNNRTRELLATFKDQAMKSEGIVVQKNPMDEKQPY